MNIDELTIGELKQVAKLAHGLSDAPSAPTTHGNGRLVIVRSRDAGVQYGNLIGYEGTTVHIANARQMYQWKAANNNGTLLGCAQEGVVASGCKFSAPVAQMTVIGACAIIDVNPNAAKSFDGVQWNN